MSDRPPSGPLAPTPSSPIAPAPEAGLEETARIRRRAHGITASILGGTAAFIWLVWAHPMILLYGVLAVVAVMAYAAVYLMVTTRLEDEESPAVSSPELEHDTPPPSDSPSPPAPAEPAGPRDPGDPGDPPVDG